MKDERNNPNGFTIRMAGQADTGLILGFIQELAAYENLSHEVVADVNTLHESLFIKKQAEVIIGEYCGEPIGFALYFHNFSTFLGKANIYLEDLYIQQQYRGKGFGHMMFAHLAAICKERGCDRLDWWCLDKNEPAIRFYVGMGARAMSDWSVYRIDGEALSDLANR